MIVVSKFVQVFNARQSFCLSRAVQVLNAITKWNFEFHMVLVVYQVVNQ